jgi:UDP-N-acetylglucosamine 3-dehydrogenase
MNEEKTNSKKERKFIFNEVIFLLKVGIIGSGKVSEEHVRALSKHPGAELTAIAETNDERRAWCKANWNVNAYADYRNMLARESFDLIINCLPHAFHYPSTVDVLNAGIHTLLEKPLATNFSDCREMICLAKQKNLILAPGHVIRYFPAVARVKRWMNTENFGNLIMMDLVRSHTNYFTGSLPQWFKSKKLCGGGILIMTGSHSIDTMQWYANSRVKSVKAKTTRSDAAPEVETTVQAFLEMDNGVTATLRQSGYKTFNDVNTELSFTNGTIQSATFEDEIKGIVGDEVRTPPALVNKDPFYEQLDVVCRAVTENTPLDVEADYSAHIVRVIQAIYRSADEGREVKVEEIE